MKKLIAILLIISVFGLAGCTILYPPEEAAEGSAQAAVNDVEDSIDTLNIESLEKELDISELEQLEQDLDEIDW